MSVGCLQTLADITAATRRRALVAKYDDAKYYLDLTASPSGVLLLDLVPLSEIVDTTRRHGGPQPSRVDAVSGGAPGPSDGKPAGTAAGIREDCAGAGLLHPRHRHGRS
jgi:hypothetical protein